jgi:hypothetical protein
MLSPRHALVEQLAEHLDPVTTFFSVDEATISISLADLHLAAIDAAASRRCRGRDRKHVFDRHHERLVDFALREGCSYRALPSA